MISEIILLHRFLFIEIRISIRVLLSSSGFAKPYFFDTFLLILYLFQPLDYEQLQNAHFSIAVKNKAEFHRSVISQYRIQSTQVKVQVINVQEGIAFRPASKTFTVQKGISRKRLINYILGTYAAFDEEANKIASNVRYDYFNDILLFLDFILIYKLLYPASVSQWLSVNL